MWGGCMGWGGRCCVCVCAPSRAPHILGACRASPHALGSAKIPTPERRFAASQHGETGVKTRKRTSPPQKKKKILWCTGWELSPPQWEALIASGSCPLLPNPRLRFLSSLSQARYTLSGSPLGPWMPSSSRGLLPMPQASTEGTPVVWARGQFGAGRHFGDPIPFPILPWRQQDNGLR